MARCQSVSAVKPPVNLRRAWSPVIACGLLLAAACGDPQLRPNVVLISFDTLRPDHLGAYGYERPTSPQLDRFAQNAALFENAFAHAPKTAPSHMSLFTGLLPEVHGVRNIEERGGALPEGIPTLASHLQLAGYRTLAITGGGNIRGALGFARGFDRYDELRRGGVFAEATRLLEVLAEERSRGDGAFFLFVHTYQIHDPYLPPPRYAELFVDPDYAGRMASTREQLLEHMRRQWEERGGEGEFAPNQHVRSKLFWLRVDERSAADRMRLVDLYDAGIRQADEQLGALLDRLRALGLEENTLVVLTSDHGEQFGEHGGFMHADVYDEILRALLVIRFPGGGQGVRIAEPVRLIDVVPTILETVGLSIPEKLQGAPLQSLVRGAHDPRAVVAQWQHRGLLTLREGRWKWIARPEGGELFDMIEDPRETRNLVGEHPDIAAEMSARLDREMAESRALRGTAPGPSAPLDPVERRQLEALGYLEN